MGCIYKAPDQVDVFGWSALHHAIDSSSFSMRAGNAALDLIPLTPRSIINHAITGRICRGFTCLHLAVDGSDKTFLKGKLVKELLEAKAALEDRTEGGVTPFLLACGTGVVDVASVLCHAGADITAVDHNNKTGMQRAVSSSLSMRQMLQASGQPDLDWTQWIKNPRDLEKKKSEAKQIRYARNPMPPKEKHHQWKSNDWRSQQRDSKQWESKWESKWNDKSYSSSGWWQSDKWQ